MVLNWVDNVSYVWSLQIVLWTWILLGIQWFPKDRMVCYDPLERVTNPENSCFNNLYIPDYAPSYPNRKVGVYWLTMLHPIVAMAVCFLLGLCLRRVSEREVQLDTTIKTIWELKRSGVKKKDISRVGAYLFDRMKSDAGVCLTKSYRNIKLMTVFGALFILYVMSLTLGESFFWPLDLWQGVPLFPLSTTCRFWWQFMEEERIVKEEYVLNCVHPMFWSYKYAFVSHWLYFVAVAVINAVDFLLAIIGWGLDRRYENTIKGHLNEENVDCFIKFLRPDGVLLLAAIEENCGPYVTRKLLRELQRKYENTLLKEVI